MKKLQQEKRWCVWKREIRPGDVKPTKVPYISISVKGSSNQPGSWQTFEAMQQLKASDKDVAGLGFFLSQREDDSNYAIGAIDIDAHNTEDKSNSLETEILDMFRDTYIERSPSGNGYHILFNMEIDRIPLDENGKPAYKQKNSENELEIYIGTAANRYMTYTGDRVSDTDVITDQTENVLAFIGKYMSRPEKTRTKKVQAGGAGTDVALTEPLTDAEIAEVTERLNLARNGARGEQFRKLYDDGDIEKYNNNHSSADFALVCMLCYWIGPDPRKIDWAFRNSKLNRLKWNSKRNDSTYGYMTIDKAIDATDDYYTPDFSVIENEDASALNDADTGKNEKKDSEFQLDKTQLMAVESEARFIRVIAGAGSGKTTVLTRRFAHLVNNKHVSPEDVLCVTFTNKAAKEMKTKINKLISRKCRNVMTLNSLGNKILEAEIYRIGWDEYQIKAAEADQIRILKEIFKKTGPLQKDVSLDDITKYIYDRKNKLEYMDYLNPNKETDIEKHLSDATDVIEKYEGKDWNSLKNSEKHECSAAKMELIYYHYLLMQRERRFTDFTDQVCLPLMIFDAYPEAEVAWSSKYRYIMVDEFQDVSTLNYALCEKLTGDKNDLFVVGDPDQMIYGWRDANYECLKYFDVKHEGTRCFELNTNYRSTKEIVRAANNLIANNETHDKAIRMIADNEAEAEKVKYIHSTDVFNSETMKTSYPGLERIADRMEELIEDWNERQKEKKEDEEKEPFPEIAVLYRNHACCENLKDILKKRSIPYKMIREDETAELPLNQKILMLLALVNDTESFSFEDHCRVLSDMEESENLWDIWENAYAGITYDDFYALVNDGNDIYPESKRLINAAEKARASIAEEGSYDLYELTIDLLNDSGIYDELNQYNIQEEQDGIDSLLERIDTMYEEYETPPTIEDLLAEYGDKKDDHEYVVFSTVHAAKGLEYDYVFVISMESDTMPSKKTDTYSQLEEERRVAYVAYTRAKKELWLSESTGGIEPEKLCPSHFIFEAGLKEGYLEQVFEPLEEDYIARVDAVFARYEAYCKIKENKKVQKLFTELREVEHPIYGRGIILSITYSGKIIVRFDDISTPITITDKSNLIPVLTKKDKAAIRDKQLIDTIESITEEDDDLTKRVKNVLMLINAAAETTIVKYKTPVFSLPCGVGKSSAISRKICQVAAAYENGAKDGLLIMSNTKTQLYDYLTPRDKRVGRWIQEHKGSIVRMDGDNAYKMKKQAKKAPVLIITTQKYLLRDRFEFQDQFLTFGNGCRRSLIIVDEEPEIYNQFTISVKELNDIDTMLHQGLTDLFNPEDKRFCLSFWQDWKQYLITLLDKEEKKAKSNGHESFYEYLKDNDLHNQKWFTERKLNRFLALLKDNRFAINRSGQKIDIDMDVYKYVWAIRSMSTRFSLAIYEFSSGAGGSPYYNRFVVITKNELYFVPEATHSRLLILDGTADISPKYSEEEFAIVRDHSFDRDLSNLRIVIHDFASGSSSLQDMNVFGQAANAVEHIIRSEHPSDEWGLFTYLKIEQTIRNSLGQYSIKTDHFNHIRGKNIYNNLKHIIQLGVNRLPKSIYLLYELYFEVSKFGTNRSFDGSNDALSSLINSESSFTKFCLDSLLLCDIEQNLFRGVIRNDSVTPYTYHLFMSSHEYSKLILAIKCRYCSKGASVVVEYRKPTKEAMFFQWHDSLPDGTEYKPEDVLRAIKSPNLKRLADFYSKYQSAETVLKKERIKNGTYIKQGYGGYKLSDIYDIDKLNDMLKTNNPQWFDNETSICG